MIYTVTSVNIKRFSDNVDDCLKYPTPRSWAYFYSFKDAEKCVKDSPGWFGEHGYYTHVVIEKLEEGRVNFDRNPIWYELIWSNEENREIKAKRLKQPPKEVKQMCGFSLG